MRFSLVKQISLRLPDDLHAELKLTSAQRKVSLHAEVLRRLEEFRMPWEDVRNSVETVDEPPAVHLGLEHVRLVETPRCPLSHAHGRLCPLCGATA